MSESKRPTMSISLKPVGGSKEDRLYLFAGWERDGKLSSLALDRKIKQLAVQWEDGTITRVSRDDGGRWSHFVDVYDSRTFGGQNSASTAKSAPAMNGTTTASGSSTASSYSDDIPF
jgi:hypothetical protein